MKNLIICLYLGLTFGLLGAQNLSPEVVASAGDRFSSGNISLDWTLGEVMTESYAGTIILTQGFQQPDDQVTSLDKLTSDLGVVNIYPNPTTETIFIEREKNESLKLSLWDTNGRLIMQKGVFTAFSSLNLSALPKGIYILRMTDEKQGILSIRVQKI